MSRPQFQQNSNQQLAQPVVNGGLIDFQDNFNRGMCEYPTPQQLMAAAAYGYPTSGLAANPALVQHFQQQPMATTCTGAVNGNNPGVNPTASTPAVPGTYISGPPTFLHVNGVTYKPVEESAVPATGKSTSISGPNAVVESDSAPPGTKMLTEKDLHKAIDQRVQSRVETYLSTRRQPSVSCSREPRDYARSSPAPPVSSRSYHDHHRPSYTGRDRAMDSSAEERAAARIQNVNASMRNGSTRSRESIRDW
jgi:hypothetical protein